MISVFCGTFYLINRITRYTVLGFSQLTFYLNCHFSNRGVAIWRRVWYELSNDIKKSVGHRSRFSKLWVGSCRSEEERQICFTGERHPPDRKRDVRIGALAGDLPKDHRTHLHQFTELCGGACLFHRACHELSDDCRCCCDLRPISRTGRYSVTPCHAPTGENGGDRSR